VLALALPTCAHAQGEVALKLLLEVLAGVYALVVLVVLLRVRRTNWRLRTKLILALALVAGPPLLLAADELFGQISDRISARHLRAVQAEDTAQAVPYLEQACATQRVVPSAAVTVHGADGLFVSSTPSLILPDAPRLAYTWFDASQAALRHRRQYRIELAWTTQVYPPTLPSDHDFAFVEEMDGDHLRASAPRVWWESQGLARVSEDERPRVLQAIASYPGRRIAWALADDQPKARYHLELADISTVEDRRHWVARGRVRLLDDRDDRVLAEYVGFFADLESNAAVDDGNSWERTLECPGQERRYALEKGGFYPVNFFFDQFVHLD